MPRSIILTNHKGGVGKSTSAANIAIGIVSMLKHFGAPNSRVLLIDLDLIRSRCPIDQIVNERFTLRKRVTRYIGVEHDSLVVVPKTESYFWNSRGDAGDVFDFVGRYILGYGDRWNSRDAGMFMEAVKLLADRAGIQLDTKGDFKKSPLWAERELVARLHEALLKTPKALDYATRTRGWQQTTLRAEQIGFMPAELIKDLYLSDKWRAAIEKFPSGMLVYIHRESRRLTYLSGRSIEGKRHYNVPVEIVGDRQPYFNHAYDEDAPYVVLVEGQADAITFSEWNIPAIALCGLRTSDALLTQLKQHKRIFVLLDNSPKTTEIAQQIAQELGVRAYIPRLPEGVNDANDWLTSGATKSDANTLLNHAPNWLFAEVERAGQLEGLAREDAIRDFFSHTRELDTLMLAQFKLAVQGLGIPPRVVSTMLKAAQDEPVEEETESADSLIDDDVPVLSPALGFGDEVELVTITLRERTRENSLRLQPYLVTSSRELTRTDGAQIIQVGNQEVALRSVPEGSEFLMRWRFTDIQRFLAGEIVSPGEVYMSLRMLVTTYIEFRSEAESHVLALWVIGTYFYSLFPAYPYLALNGPKNSGKSTVLRVLQPLAFNMVTTADPTGASMFRLIDRTSCTVGIDESSVTTMLKTRRWRRSANSLTAATKPGCPRCGSPATTTSRRPSTFTLRRSSLLLPDWKMCWRAAASRYPCVARCKSCRSSLQTSTAQRCGISSIPSR